MPRGDVWAYRAKTGALHWRILGGQCGESPAGELPDFIRAAVDDPARVLELADEVGASSSCLWRSASRGAEQPPATHPAAAIVTDHVALPVYGDAPDWPEPDHAPEPLPVAVLMARGLKARPRPPREPEAVEHVVTDGRWSITRRVRDGGLAVRYTYDSGKAGCMYVPRVGADAIYRVIDRGPHSEAYAGAWLRMRGTRMVLGYRRSCIFPHTPECLAHLRTLLRTYCASVAR